MDQKKILVVGLALVFGYIAWNSYSGTQVQPDREPLSQEEPMNQPTEKVPLTIGKASLMVEIRDTIEERGLGLSYRKSMAQDEGMLFVFDEAQPVTFWMKGMHFDLDMIWIREGVVVDISEEVPAPTEENPVAKTVAPKEEVDAVLEVNSGFVARHGIVIGDEVAY
jgi:uncharacterized protein